MERPSPATAGGGGRRPAPAPALRAARDDGDPPRPPPDGRRFPGVAPAGGAVVMDQRAKAKRFLELHTSGRLLVLPNAWDAGSARIFEHAGFQALGTTSAGVALSLGYPDGERVSRAEMLEVARRIAGAVAGIGRGHRRT